MERREATRFPIAREAKHDLCALRRSMPLAFSGARRQRPPRTNCAAAMTLGYLKIKSDQETRATALSFILGSTPKGGVAKDEAARVPGATQRVKSAFTRVFNALWLRRPGTVESAELGAAPDQQRTAHALRSIRGTLRNLWPHPSRRLAPPHHEGTLHEVTDPSARGQQRKPRRRRSDNERAR